MKPSYRFAWLTVILMLATAAGVFVASLNRSPPEENGADKDLATQQLLALTLPNASEVSQPLSQWRGKMLVVNFWATWCSPCREEMPGFSRLQSKYADKGVQFVGIAFDSADKVQKFSLQTPVSYPLLIGSAGLLPITAGLGNPAGGLPFTALIGRDGRLLQTRLGIWKETAFEAVLLSELAK